MNLEGTWKLTNHWDGQNPYSFSMTITSDGLATAEGGFEGTILQLGSSAQVAMGLSNCQASVSSTYIGNSVGPAMGGSMRGLTQNEVVNGTWSAVRMEHATAPSKECSVC